MPSVTTAYVKNIICRGFSELVDPGPSRTDVAAIWKHFNNACAYCGRKLRRQEKEGHIDHLVPASGGGANALGNRVLSCASCNEKEKMDGPWEPFLRDKADTFDEFEARRQRIVEWQQIHPVPVGEDWHRIRQAAGAGAERVIELFDDKVCELRKMVRDRAPE